MTKEEQNENITTEELNENYEYNPYGIAPSLEEIWATENTLRWYR